MPKRLPRSNPPRARRNHRPRVPLSNRRTDLLVLLIFLALCAALSLLVTPTGLAAIISAALLLYAAYRGKP